MPKSEAAKLLVATSFPIRQSHQPPCSGKFARLAIHPSLATGKGATVEVVLPTCHECSSKLCLLLGPFETKDLHSKGNCARITTLGQLPE